MGKWLTAKRTPCMCVVNKQVCFGPVYVNLQYDEIFLTLTAGYVCLCGVCNSPWSVCEVVMIPYVVSAVVAVTVMHVLLFVLHVCVLPECNADVGSGGSVFAVNAYMGGTRGSGVLSSAYDVLEMCVFGSGWGGRIGFGLYQSWRNRNICLWQISQIQTCLREVVGPGLVSTSPAFMRSSASHPAGLHGQLVQKIVIRPHCWGREW